MLDLATMGIGNARTRQPAGLVWYARREWDAEPAWLLARNERWAEEPRRRKRASPEPTPAADRRDAAPAAIGVTPPDPVRARRSRLGILLRANVSSVPSVRVVPGLAVIP